MDLATARALLPEIRQLCDLASPHWCEAYNVEKGMAELCTREGPAAPVEPIALILPECGYDDRRLMIKAHELLTAARVLLDESFRIIRENRKLAEAETTRAEEREKAKPAKVLSTLYGKPAFLKYLKERHGLERPLTKERADTKVKFLLRITSKTELNEPGPAQEAWNRLLTDYNTWRKS